MLSRRTLTLTAASLLAGPVGTARAAQPLWVSGEVPPYLWRGAKGPEGYAFELFQRVTRQAGVAAELHFYPWARAFRMLQAGQAHAALVITRTPEREAQFRWLFPVGSFHFAIVTRAADGITSSDITALRPYRVASMRASVSRRMLEVAGVPHVVEGRDYADLLALLQRGVVDAVMGPDAVLRSLGSDGLRVTLLDQRHELYAAAAAAMPDDTVQRLRAAYQQLVDSGAIAQLRKRHPGLFFDE
jgi:polar amino acid transport system substrate-binding protein